MNYGYDELGNLTTRRYGGDSRSLAEDLSYNLRGWLTSKSNEKFSMTLAYNAPHHPQVAPSYTGNITEWNWTHADSGEENTYSFTYDSQSRLTDTRQYIDGLEVDQFVERNLSYDRNGNIQSLHRYEHGELKSNFAYTYTGNRLKTISDMQASPQSRSFANWGSADSLGGIRPDPIDPGIPVWPIDPVDPGNPGVIIPPVIDPAEPVDPTDPIGPIGPDNPGPGIVVPPGITDPTDPNPGGGIDPDIPSVVVRPGDPDKPTEPGIRQDSIYSGSEYVYDVNGNMLYDPMEGLNIRYNHLNLIEKVLRGDTIVAKYSYLSDGTKLSATDADGNGLYYLGSLVYGSRNGDLSLESAAFNGGRFIVTSNGIESHYFVTDHLGSVRAVVNNDGEVIERNDYYPFGLRWNAGELSDNRYRYNGKETQSFVDVPYTDYGARMLDSKYRLGWNGVDLMAETYRHIGPYAFCGNNPINRVDPNGMKWASAEDLMKAGMLLDIARTASSELSAEMEKEKARQAEINNNTKLSQKQKDRKLERSSTRMNELELSKVRVDNFIDGLGKIEKDIQTTYTYNIDPGKDVYQLSSKTDGTIVINTSGNTGNMAHETSHAIQHVNGEISVKMAGTTSFNYHATSQESLETEAYTVQYLIGGQSSMPTSSRGGIPSRVGQITPRWVGGLLDRNYKPVYSDLYKKYK